MVGGKKKKLNLLIDLADEVSAFSYLALTERVNSIQFTYPSCNNYNYENGCPCCSAVQI